jgi:hypothetical protein
MTGTLHEDGCLLMEVVGRGIPSHPYNHEGIPHNDITTPKKGN